MASGRMQYLSTALNRLTEFSFVINNDPQDWEREGNPCYDRPAKNLYLLHGLTGIDTDWLWGGGNAHQAAKRFNLNIFMPTCGNNFYLDRPGKGSAYGSFVGAEFVDYTRRTFGLSAARADTLVGGLSMGGFGALHTAFAYPETFSGCIALSSANPTEPAAPDGSDNPLDRYDLAFHREVFGPDGDLRATEKNPKVRLDRLLETGKPLPRLYVACGTEDELIWINRRYRDHFQPRLAEFRYEEGPGIHSWDFWTEYLFRGLRWMLEETSQ